VNTSEQLAPVLAAGGSGLARGLRLAEARLGEVAAGHGEVLAGHAGGTLAAGGKRLRPLLVFLCAGREEPGEALVAGAAAVELLHMATLVHDDVLDRAPLRRGYPTVFATAGRDAATATGDLLFARAFAELAATGSAPAVQALSTASTALARGELMQRDDAWNAAVTRERYRERCGLKTGSLFAASCRLGAELGDRGGAAGAALASFGDRVGVAFQLLDDVLDVSGPVEETGKHRGTDLLDGTVTLPLIVARERDPELAAIDLRADVATPRAAEKLCDRIAATGALDAARSEALEIVAAAKRDLAAIELERWQREALDLVADGVVARYA
jgi:geranylgeranyl pyrophosphate synthase